MKIISKRNGIIVGILLLVVIVVYRIAGSRGGTGVQGQNIPRVNVEQPRRETVINKLQFTGDVLPTQQANIFSKVNGTLEHIYVDIGTAVRKNQLLALIDTTELSQQANQAAATYANARINFERNKELIRENLVSKEDLDNSEASMKVAAANYEIARTRLSYAMIRAPFPGYITKRYLDPGAVIQSNNTTIFTLMDLNLVKIMLNVLEKDIMLITIGKKATVTVDAFPGKEFYGEVTRYSQSVDLATRTMAVEIDIPNPEKFLKPGMFADILLVVDAHPNTLTIPTQAILKDDKGNFVFVVDKNIAHRTPIQAGGEQNSRTEILSGLNGNENIITVGQQLVRDGNAVIF